MDCVTNIAWKTTGCATLGGVAYEYDAIGRITARSLGVGTNSSDRAYAYDDLDRLASDGGVAYTYDAAGNRMTRTEDGATVTYTLGVGDRLTLLPDPFTLIILRYRQLAIKVWLKMIGGLG